MNGFNCLGEQLGHGTHNLFVLGDAVANMPRLIESYAGQVQLIYLDPPFQTGSKFTCKLHLGSHKHATVNVPSYDDDMPSAAYYAMMREILTGCHKLLSPEGNLFLHIDPRTSARLRIMLDEIFGEDHFVNEIIWHYKSGGRAKNHFSRKHDVILFYRRTKNAYFDITSVGIPRGKDMQNHMRRTVDEEGRVVYTIKSGGKVYTYSEDTPVYPSDVWTDISHLQQKDPERTGYDTQKPEALLKRIILSASRPGDLVMDLFSGSGTTAATAVKCSRRFVTMDSSPIALSLLRRRILNREPTLMDADLPGTLLLFDAFKPPKAGNLEYTCSRANGRADVTLVSYTPPDGTQVPENCGSLSLLDYCALGFVKEGIFSASSFNLRPLRGGTVAKLYLAPDKPGLCLLIHDVFGRQSVFPVE
ncbi:MAG: DNA methyltransferase [Christensenellales bacterium]|jgi:DNA modification methylase